MPKSQRETHFEEISPALAKVVLNMSKLKDNKIKNNKNTLFLYYFLGFAFLIYFLVLILIFT